MYCTAASVSFSVPQLWAQRHSPLLPRRHSLPRQTTLSTSLRVSSRSKEEGALEGSSSAAAPPTKATPTANSSLLDQIGGEPALNAVVDRFYDTLLQDPRVSPLFDGTNMARQRQMQKSFLSGVLGGRPYSGKSMRAAHMKLNLTDDHFDAVAQNLHAALDHFGVEPEQVQKIMGIVSGTRDEVLGRE